MTDLKIKQGSEYRIQWPVLDGNGDPMSTVGWAARAQARASMDSSEVLQAWDSDDDTLELAEGTLTLIVAAAMSEEWDWTYALYDVEMVSPTGVPTRVAQGSIEVDREVTR
jgi:hypothetical protein